MAYQGSKGWYVQQLKNKGINRHPIDRRKLESYKASTLRKLYVDLVIGKEQK
ncbi:YflJ family protein [Bacillus timonensis]|nr:YflJ family protein [Bacillus timonensis]